MKIFFRRIHLYLGLTAGLIITISCLTGSLLVFEKELTEAFNHSRYYVQPVGERLSLDQVAAMIKQQVPGAGITRIQVFADPARTIQVVLDESKKGGEKEAGAEGNVPEDKKSVESDGKDIKESVGKSKNGGPEGVGKAMKESAGKSEKGGMEGGEKMAKKEKGRVAFVNPYTGKVVELFSYQQTFYAKVLSLHRFLLAGDTGKIITGTSSLIFLFILATGIVLWWPKTRNIFKQRIKVKWGGGWKRLNHDMHVVLGFYAAIFLFMIAFIGVVWAFEWFGNGFYAALGASRKVAMTAVLPPASTPLEDGKRITYEVALAQVKQQVPDAVYYILMPPKDNTTSFQVNLLPATALHENFTTICYLDQFSGKVLQLQTFAQRSRGQQIRYSLKPVHTGAIFGLPSKIFILVIALMGVIFPTTGTIMWINRTRKKKKKIKSPAISNKEKVAKQVA